jgi:hydroxymethylglutaryl-CoA reductase
VDIGAAMKSQAPGQLHASMEIAKLAIRCGGGTESNPSRIGISSYRALSAR